MQLRVLASSLLAAPLVLIAAGPAHALCSLVVLTSGTLALSSDGQRLGSTEAGGLPATFTVASVGASTLTISSPSLVQAPAAHSQAGDTFEVAYQGAGVLASASQSYTTGTTSVAVPNLIGTVVVTVNNRITNNGGFAPGSYRTRTVVTCS